jgi:hypothetical protein
VTVAVIEACSKVRPPGWLGSFTIVPFGTQANMAGTRTPSRSNRNSLPVPVSFGQATKPSGMSAGISIIKTTIVSDCPVLAA